MTGPPRFHVPDVDPLELGDAGADVDRGAAGPGGPPDLTLIDGGREVALTVDQVAAMIELPFAVLAMRRGDHWKLRADESALIADPLTRKLNEHARVARGLEVGGDYVVIIGGLVIILSARLLEDASRAASATDRTAPGPGMATDADTGTGGAYTAGAGGDGLGGRGLNAGGDGRIGGINGGFVAS